MPFKYPIFCTAAHCTAPAAYKVAARWSDGLTEELKTYGLTCEKHLAKTFRDSLKKQQACRLVEGESLDAPSIFLLKRERPDEPLQRLVELERQIMSGE